MRRAARLGAALFLAGCASDSRYADLPEKNLVVRTETGSARAVLGVHAVDAQCRLTYEGSVQLDRPVVRVGIPAGRPSYLVFRFATSSFLGSRQGSISEETLLRPRRGATYDVQVTYRNELYEVVVREVPEGGGRPRQLPLAGLSTCRQ